MRKIAFAVVILGIAAPALAAPALAAPAPARCTGAAVTDSAGDVEVASGVTVPDDHVDLRTVNLVPTSTAFLVTFTDTKLDANRKGVWRLTFTSRHKSLYVTAGLGIWANAGSTATVSGYHAGVVGQTAHPVTGVFDYPRSTIRVLVPYAAFDSALPHGTTVLTGVTVEASETFAHAGTAGTPSQNLALTDTAHAAKLALTRC
jgi:hypothetical protein